MKFFILNLYRYDKQNRPISAMPHCSVCLYSSAFKQNEIYYFWTVINFILVLFFIPNLCFGQITDENSKNNCNKLFAKYIPKGYEVLDTSKSDFNKDGRTDIAIILNKKNAIETDRAILILQKTANGYQKNVFNANAMYCKDCGGIYGDPYAQMTFRDNIIRMTNYGGSSWRWDYSYTFRYQHRKWELIGIAYFSYHSTGCTESCDVTSCSLQLTELSYSTKKAHFIETEDGSCIPKKEFWKKIKTQEKISFLNFNCNTDYFKKIK